MTQKASIIGTAFALVLVTLTLPAYAGAQAADVSGTVRDARGTPQIGALVELLRPDFSTAGKVFTDSRGHYSLKRVQPGTYSLKATDALFLPTLRENLSVLASSKMVVNLTLSTLYEAFRWLPAQPRQADEPKDDWTWTLRLSANRPLLRLLEDGPLVVVSDGGAPALKARVTVSGGAGEFGDGGLHHDFEVERSTDGAHQLIFRADLSGAQSPSINSTVGYEQQLAPGRNMVTVAAFEDRPDIAGGPQQQGVQSMVLRSAETINLTPAIEAEAGSQFEAVHFAGMQVASRPFADVNVRAGGTTVSYRLATSAGAQRADHLDRDASLVSAMSEQDGHLRLQHGLHQELGVESRRGDLRMHMVFFRDRLQNPVVSGGGRISAADWNGGDLLYDPSTGLLQATGRDFTGSGFLGEIEDNTGNALWLSLSYAMGDALEMDPLPVPVTFREGIMGLKPERTQMIAASVSGNMGHDGTHWRASYRWQSGNTVTAVDPFNGRVPGPYLNLYLRQPIQYHHVLPNGIEALVDVHNLLAQGYRPFVTRDGSTLYFAQVERCLRGGLSFSF